MKARLSVVTALLLAVSAPTAAQYVDPTTCSMADFSCQQAVKESSDKRAADDAWYEERARRQKAERDQLRRDLVKQPPLPAERNVLLGSWRLGDGPQGPTAALFGQGTGGGAGAGTGWDTSFQGVLNMAMSFEKLMCDWGPGSGVTFAPATYAVHGGPTEASVAYRAATLNDKPAIAAIPGDNAQDMMVFALADLDHIVAEDGCVLVRSGAPAAAANATTAPGNARAAASGSSSSPAGAATPAAAAGRAREPIEPISRLGRGVQLHGEKDFQQALQQLLVAAQSDPNDPRVYVYLADTYGWLGMDAEAKQAAERAKQLDPNAFEILR